MKKFDSRIYEEAKNTSAMSNSGCGTCQRNGMPFFLVRQSVIHGLTAAKIGRKVFLN